MTIDGRIATAGGESRWITGEAARDEVHQLRSRVDAIAVGMGTVVADDPMLTARLGANRSPARIPTRVVFCRHRLPAVDSNLVRTAREVPLMLVLGHPMKTQQLSLLESKGAILVETETADPAEMVEAAMEEMGNRQMTNVMLEGGGELLASFFSAGQIDECHVYIGAKAFGGQHARGPIGGSGVEKIANAWSLKLVSVDQFDDDLRVVYRRFDG
jgi:diaminohydroxyphosphoribosylaminopyrimidine deaminase/5-amino-6-(5-phosphoribosylamino)uracil reductase